MAAVRRDKHGKYRKNRAKERRHDTSVRFDHNYCVGSVCEGDSCKNPTCLQCDIPSFVDQTGWRVGRRLIELSVLLKNLETCTECNLGPVSLTSYNVVGERKRGLGGFIYVRCQNPDCNHINRAAYSKVHRQRSKKVGMPCFDVNTKLGTAMIDNIGGPRRVNNFLTTLNIPSISNPNLKVMERRAGVVVEAISDRSTHQAAKDAYHKEMMDISTNESNQAAAGIENLDDDLGVGLLCDSSPSVREILQSNSTVTVPDDDGWTDDEENGENVESDTNKQKCRKKTRKTLVRSSKIRKQPLPAYPCKTQSGMSLAVDTAWQKRGFDSLTGHTFFMSKAKYGKKVCKTVITHRTCGTCKYWQRNRHTDTVRPHRCVANHTGSARMIESVSGEQGLDELHKSGIAVEYIEGDGDSTMMARVRNKYPHLKKRYDKNHVVKNVGKNFLGLQASKKAKISRDTVRHIQKCLTYSLSKNQGDKDCLKENLESLIPHQFGDHSKCHERFCGSKANPAVKYTHKSLPHKTALKDDGILRSELEKIMAPVVANSSAYADLGSSQQCEHANREVALRAPKTHHYGESESLDFRVKATAACINEGREYLCQAFTEAGLSPGFHTMKHAEKRLQERKKELDKAALPSTKRRRLILKHDRAMVQGTQEVVEGDTYDSGVALDSALNTETIPDPVPRGNFSSVQTPSGEITVVVMDLETTDLIQHGNIPDITQIAAMNVSTGETFSSYVIPHQPIAFGAQQVTGIVFSGGVMTVHGKAVLAKKIHTALEEFCLWLEQNNNVILLAHNGKKFDFPVIVSACASNGLLDRFCLASLGCIDSLNLFKKVFPNQPSYKQEELVKNILNETYNAHDAIADVAALGRLYSACHKLSRTDFLAHSFAVKSVFHNQLFLKAKATNLPSLNVILAQGICKNSTAENIAGSGLNLGHLRKIFNRDGQDGLLNVFRGKNSEGQPRVTNNKRVLDSVIPRLSEYFSK